LAKIKRTVTEKKFIKAYIENGGNATEAYLSVNPKTKRETAGEMGYRLLKKVEISDDEIMETLGINDAYLMQKIKEGVEATKVVSVVPIPPKKNESSTADLPDANSKNVEFIDVEDYPTRHKYLDMILKLRNKYPAEKKDIDLNLKGKLEMDLKMDENLSQLKPEDLKKLVTLKKKNANKQSN
jgi:hypothetical protein